MKNIRILLCACIIVLAFKSKSQGYNWFTLPTCPNMQIMVDSFVITTPTHRLGRIMMIVFPQSDFSDSCLCEIPDSLYPGWEFTHGYRAQQYSGVWGPIDQWHAGDFNYNMPAPTEIYFDSAQSKFVHTPLQTNTTVAGVYMQKPLVSANRIVSPKKNTNHQRPVIYNTSGQYIGPDTPETVAKLPKGMYIVIDQKGNIKPKKIIK